jgi:hypothetical protein
MEQEEKQFLTELEVAPPDLMQNVMLRLQQREDFIHEHQSIQELAEGLHHPAWEVRAAAIRTLARHDIDESRAALVNATSDEHPLVRAAALRGLSKSKGTLAALTAGLHDPAWEVREMAQLLLQEQTQHEERLWKTQLQHLWNVLISQPKVMHYGTWLASAIVLAIFSVFFFAHQFQASILSGNVAATWLTIMIVGASAISSTFIYGQEVDPALELVLTAPVSPRLLLACRMLLLSAYNILFGGLLSVLIVLLYGGDFWQIVQLWLGPLILLSTVSMTLSLFASSMVVIGTMLAIEGFQFLAVSTEQRIPLLHSILTQFWQTNPQILLLTFCLLLFTFCCMPERKRYAR